MRFIICTSLLLLLWCLVMAADVEQTYAIVLERSQVVGEKYHLSASGSEQSTTAVYTKGESVGGKTTAFSMKLDGVAKVLAVDARKQPIKLALTISSCVKTDGETIVPLAKTGTIVICTAMEDSTSFTINSARVSDNLQKALDIAINLSKNRPGDDQLFGTQQPRHVGDDWEVNAAKITQSLAGSKFNFTADDVSGKTTLKEALTVNGQPCLRIATQFQIRNFKIFAPVELKQSSVSFSTSGIYPNDAAQGIVEKQSAMTMQVETAPDKNMTSMQLTNKR